MGYAKRGGSIVNGMLVEKHFFQKEIFTKETILNYFIHKNKLYYRHRLTLVGSAHVPASPERV
jgi:hypothetical protein